jgi:hypothetical protein
MGSMRSRTLIAMCWWCAAAGAGLGIGAAAPSAAPAECARPLGAIAEVRAKIDAGRDALTADEAECAFVEFTIGELSGRCVEVRARATPKAMRAWGEVKGAWQELDRLRLDLRKLEDRLGAECEPQ